LRVLFLAPQVPWPLDTGGKIRTRYLLRALARAHRVKVLAFGDRQADSEGVAAISRMGADCELIARPGRVGELIQLARGLAGPVPCNIRKYQSLAFGRRLRQLAPEQDLVHCDHIHMARYGATTGLPYAVDEHNVETLIWDRFARDDQEPLLKRALFAQQAFLLRRVERDLCSRASMVTLCSRADQTALLELIGGHRHPPTQVIPNGVDVEFFSETGPAEVKGHIFFTGSMDWAPNENAVLAFLDEMWPEIRRAMAGLSFYVVGRRPTRRLWERHRRDGVHITGTVPDVRPFMRGALALVVPMRVGGGTRLKILEAFAARVPVVSTAIGIEGITAEDGVHYLRAESVADFAAALTRLRQDPARGRKLTEAAFGLAQDHYSWDAAGGRLAQEYADRFGRASWDHLRSEGRPLLHLLLSRSCNAW